ncbi:MAG: DUF3293 domain-containing protein [Stenotrophomonas sp.]|uniref:DUF3293 domain-containing protein n=1 Tax=Stenotrophomonas sp. TaxID=69392 RepID=UPI001988363F|nr:DUF3293 domain-containing protein [Stenotrophomonas sp.]MBD3743392.1 DUF3293 domain-containing protein [Stenotrophomonas sp.]
MTPVQPDLAHSFARTVYRVHLPGRDLDLRIGLCHPQLDAFLHTLGASRWVVLSPCNPGARLLDDASNVARMAALRQTLADEGLRHFPAVGLPAAEDHWPPEPSLLILDLAPEQATQLARRFGQLAWVSGEAGQPAELAWSSVPRV